MVTGHARSLKRQPEAQVENVIGGRPAPLAARRYQGATHAIFRFESL